MNELTKVRRPTAVRREEIIRAAVELWAERGYHATSIDDLARATGLGKGALYHHIGSKEEILFEIHNRFVDPILEYGERLLESGKTPPEALADLSESLLQTIAQYRDYVVVFFREVNSLSPERFLEVREKRKRFERIVDWIIQSGIESGAFAAAPAHLLTLAFLGMHNYAYTWMRPDGAKTPREIAELFTDVFLEGIAQREPSR